MHLAIPILHHPEIHGDIDKPFIGHYINHASICVEEFMKEIINLNQWLKFIKVNLNNRKSETKHPIRNYWNIVDHPKIELVETHRLETGEEICIIKTHLIKRIQRRWRQILKERT